MSYPPPYHTEGDEARVFDAIDAIRHATLLVPSGDGLQVASPRSCWIANGVSCAATSHAGIRNRYCSTAVALTQFFTVRTRISRRG